MRCYRNDIDHASAAKLERRKVRGQYIVGRQYEALKPGIHALIMPDAEMDLAAFQQWHLVHAKSLRQLYAHVREAFGISRQECGQDALDCLRRCGHLEYAGVPTFEGLQPPAEQSQPSSPTTPMS